MTSMRTRNQRGIVWIVTAIAATACFTIYSKQLPLLLLRERRELNIEVYKDFCIFPNVISTEAPDFERITLILHVTADHLKEDIVDQIRSWDAPVSLAVHLHEPGMEYQKTMVFLATIAAKYQFIADNLRAHLFYRQRNGTACTIPRDEPDNSEKMAPEEIIRKQANYPINVARNLARKYAMTNYIFIGDYDHYYSANFEESVREVARKEFEAEPKQVLLVRRFEVNESSISFPSTKSELKRMLDLREAFVFHFLYWKGGHLIEGLEEWLEEEEGGNGTSGIFRRNIKFSGGRIWEPLFVQLATAPWHDEDFPYKIDDNVCLRWELCRAGYIFTILSDHFTYHKGIKTEASERGFGAQATTKIKEIKSRSYNEAMRNFRQRMDGLYPQTAEQCPKF